MRTSPPSPTEGDADDYYAGMPAAVSQRPTFLSRLAFFRRLPRWGRILAALTLFGAITVCAVLVRYEFQQRKARNTALLWDIANKQIAQQDIAGLRETLDRIRAITPENPRLTRWEVALTDGRADAGDLSMVRLVMNEHLRADRLPDAAREAAVRVAAMPQDWQGRCILAHHALVQGKRDEARKHLAALPPPFDLEYTLGPGPILYALHLSRQLGEPNPAHMNYLVVQVLPALESAYVPHILMTEKLQLLEAYVYAFTALDTYPQLASMWVPAGTLGRHILNDPKATPGDLTRLGHVFEGLRPFFAELRRRQAFPAAEVDGLSRELDERVVKTWARVIELDPKASAGYIGCALALARERKLDEATAVMQSAITACGARIELLAALARLKQHTDPVAGMQMLLTAANDRPKDPTVWRLVAETAEAAGRPDVVIDACDRALAVQSGLVWARMQKAQSLLSQDKATAAVATLEPIRAACAEDQDGAALYVRATCAAGGLDMVDAFIEQALAGPRPIGAVTGAAAALLSAGQTEPAERWANKVIALAPNDRPARRVLAESLRLQAEAYAVPKWDLDRVRAALHAYEWLQKREPNDLGVATTMARLELTGQGNIQAAVRLVAPLREREGSMSLSGEMLAILGDIDLAQGNLRSACALLERATRATPGRPTFWSSLAIAYWRAGRREESRTALNRARALPKSEREMGDFREALKVCE